MRTTLGENATWAEFKLALSKRFGLTERQVKMRLWECQQGDDQRILAYFDRLEALREQAPGLGISDYVLFEVVRQNACLKYKA